MFEYWRESPPTHELVAAYIGYKSPERKKREGLTTEDWQFIQALGPQKVKTFDNLPPQVQDWLVKNKKESKSGT